MKKAMILILTVLILVSAVACGGKEDITWKIKGVEMMDTLVTVEDMMTSAGVDVSRVGLVLGGNGTMTMTFLGQEGAVVTVEGTWRESADGYNLIAEGETIEATFRNDKTELVIETELAKLIFEQ